MRIILSRDRAAQLDLLLASLERNAEPEETIVIARASSTEFARGYEIVDDERVGFDLWWEDDFEGDVRTALGGCQFTTFLCDDDIYFGRSDWRPDWTEDLLTFSPRLGLNTTIQYPSGLEQAWPATGYSTVWNWQQAELDFGYPGSVDGHVFRTEDLQRMLAGKSFPNPTALECALVAGCDELAAERPLMTCYPHSVLVGCPINKVSEQSNVRHGGMAIDHQANLNESFLNGFRLDLDAIDFTRVDGAHAELVMKWRQPVESRA